MEEGKILVKGSLFTKGSQVSLLVGHYEWGTLPLPTLQWFIYFLVSSYHFGKTFDKAH